MVTLRRSGDAKLQPSKLRRPSPDLRISEVGSLAPLSGVPPWAQEGSTGSEVNEPYPIPRATRLKAGRVPLGQGGRKNRRPYHRRVVNGLRPLAKEAKVCGKSPHTGQEPGDSPGQPLGSAQGTPSATPAGHLPRGVTDPYSLDPAPHACLARDMSRDASRFVSSSG